MGYACCLLERVVATVPHSTTAATGCIAAVWAWGWQLLLCLDAGYSFFFFGVLRHCVLDTVLGFGSVEMGWRQERTMACDVRNLLGTKVSYYSLVVADVLPLGNGPFGFWLYAEVF
jgi:hypothetical protein